LENAIERAVIIASGRQIELDDLPEAVSKRTVEERSHIRGERVRAASEGRAASLDVDIPSTMDEVERQVIEATLDYTGGDKTRAAKTLGIGRKTLYRKLEQYGLRLAGGEE
jgi:two-component system response regulator HydG